MPPPKKITTARALRQRETDLERRLWQKLRGRQNGGLKFRRQHAIGPYVADFACPEVKLVIEIDGYWHTQRRREDALRTERLRDLGYEVARFETTDAIGNIDLLVEAIVFAAKERAAHLAPR